MPRYYTVPTSNAFAGLESGPESDSDKETRILPKKVETPAAATTVGAPVPPPAATRSPAARSQVESPNGRKRPADAKDRRPERRDNGERREPREGDRRREPREGDRRREPREGDRRREPRDDRRNERQAGEESPVGEEGAKPIAGRSHPRREKEHPAGSNLRDGPRRQRPTGFETGPNRVFDRRSAGGPAGATERKEAPRQNKGATDWSKEAEWEESPEGAEKTKAEDEEAGNEAAVSGWEDSTPKESQERKSDKPVTKTLADFKREMEDKKKELGLSSVEAIPEVDEVAINNKLTKDGYVMLSKEEETKGLKVEKDEHRAGNTKSKKVVDLADFGYQDSGRGGRGRGRGGRGRGDGGRGHDSHKIVAVEAPNLLDDQAFPTLNDRK